jgi:hypothetical protein
MGDLGTPKCDCRFAPLIADVARPAMTVQYHQLHLGNALGKLALSCDVARWRRRFERAYLPRKLRELD